MKKILLCTALLSFPCAGFADQFSGSVSLGFGSLGLDGETAQTINLEANVALLTDSGLSLGARFDNVSGDLTDGFGDIGTTMTGVSAGYRLASNVGAGVYLERAELNLDGFEDLAILTSYGVTLDVQLGGLNMDAFYGRSTTSPEVDGVTIEDGGFSANYQVNGLTLAGNVVKTRVSVDADSADLTATGVAAVYAVTDQLTAFGGISRTTPDGFDIDATSMGLGVSYDTSAVTRFGSVVSVEFARTTLSVDSLGDDLDTLRLGLTIPFGAKTAKVPTNSVAGAVLTPTHSAVTSLLMTSF